MSFAPTARRIDTYIGVLGDGNGVVRINGTDKVIVELFERGSQMVVQGILGADVALPAEGTIVWLIPETDRCPSMLRVLTDLLP